MGVSFWWRLKAKLTGKSFADSIVSAEAIATQDAKIAQKIEGYQTDEQKIDSFRKDHARNIFQLKKIEDRSDKRKTEELDGQLEYNLKKYERALKKELADIQKIIELSSKIVSNEHLSILYDIRRPLMLFEHYRKKLTSNLKNVVIDEKTKTEIISLMNAIQKEYDGVIRDAIDLCGQMQKAGAEGLKESGRLAESLKERARIKKQLGGRYLVLINQINSLERYFRALKKEKALSPQESDRVLENIQKFRNNFNLLRENLRVRIETSENTIKDAVLLQKRKLEELTYMNDEIAKITPNLTSRSRETLNNCKDIINAIEKEDGKIIQNEQATETATVNNLVRDESRLYSESPVNAETVGSKTVLDAIRKKSKAIAFILLGTFAVSFGAPAVQAIRCNENKGDKILLVGAPANIEEYMKAEGAANFSESNIESETQLIVNVTKTYNVAENTLFNFSTHFNNDEGITDSLSFAKTLNADIQKDIQDIISTAKSNLYNQLRDTKLSKEEKDKIFREAAVSELEFLPSESSVKGFTCPEGSIIGRNATNNNDTLSLLRAKTGFSILTEVLNKIQKDSVIHINSDSLSRIPVNGEGAIYKHAKVHIAVNRLNEFVKKVSPELMNRFFGFPEYAKYSEYNNKDKLQIDYYKLSTGDEFELLKFDLAARLLRAVNPNEYEKSVKDFLKELRKVEIKLSFKANVKVYGSGKTLIITMLPTADLPLRETKPFYQRNNKPYVPQTIGKPNTKGFPTQMKGGIPRDSGGKRGGNYVNRTAGRSR